MYEWFSGYRADMRPFGRYTHGSRASIGRLADGSRLAARPLHALHRPGGAYTATFRYNRSTRVLCRKTCALY